MVNVIELLVGIDTFACHGLYLTYTNLYIFPI